MIRTFRFPFLFSVLLLAGCAGGAPAPDANDKHGPAQPASQGPSVLPAPSALIGNDAAAVKAQMGTPELVRRDGPAEIWQYVGPDCTANLFLYRDASGGALSLDHIDVVGRGGKRMDAAACFADIEKGRGG